MDSSQIINKFRAAIPVVALDAPSVEERSILEKIAAKIGNHEKINSPVFVWNLADGMQEISYNPETGVSFQEFSDYNPGQDPILGALNAIAQHKDKGIFVLVDLHYYLGSDPQRLDLAVVRQLKSLCFSLKQSYKRIILLGQGIKLADDLSSLVHEIHCQLPTEEDIREWLTLCFQELSQNFTVNFAPEDLDRLVRSAQGLTLEELGDGLRLATIANHGVLDVNACQEIYNLKVAKLLKLKLELSPPPTVEIGGLHPLKDWIGKRTKLFNAALTQGNNIPQPKGLLLVGLPGTGKSLVAKTIGKLWNVPILKLDLGSLMDSLVGASEANMRSLLRTAEAVAPCVLLIDEIEKAFAGSTGPSTDSGVGQRMFGNFLSWMSDKTAPVFVVATANDISQLPPELSRKGRFDEIFFVDLPSLSERKEILKLHLKGYPVSFSDMEIERLAITSENFSGAEIEAAVNEAAIRAFDEDRYPEIDLDDINAAINSTVPLAKSYQKKVEGLREWAKIARPASLTEPERTVKRTSNYLN